MKPCRRRRTCHYYCRLRLPMMMPPTAPPSVTGARALHRDHAHLCDHRSCCTFRRRCGGRVTESLRVAAQRSCASPTAVLLSSRVRLRVTQCPTSLRRRELAPIRAVLPVRPPSAQHTYLRTEYQVLTPRQQLVPQTLALYSFNLLHLDGLS